MTPHKHSAAATDVWYFCDLKTLQPNQSSSQLPIQASAVPCELIFSSSKETCALRRTGIRVNTYSLFLTYLRRKMTMQLIMQVRQQYMSSSLQGTWRSCGI
ncbi:hypothetical protein BGY98DRAFT_1012073, partial [Russula aff. rugulosa BPL654]